MKKKALGMLGLAAAGWVGWRILSKTRALPCPSQLAWLVEMENPLASAARSTTVIERLQPQPGERIADIGCGPGRLTLPLARAVGHFGEIIALDLQSAMLAKLRVKAEREELSNIRYLQADMANADIEAGSLDGAVLVMALGEMPQPANILAAIHHLLRPGGRLVIAESIFDPHYIRRPNLQALATQANYTLSPIQGNHLAYNLLLTKPT